MTDKPARRPGDTIIDHYVPHLSPADRELARQRLQALARLLLDIMVRQHREDMHSTDSRARPLEDRIPAKMPPSS